MAIAPSLERELTASNDSDILDELREKSRRYSSDSEYPAPEIGDILDFVATERSRLNPWRRYAERERERRYLRDETPIKIQDKMSDGRRFYSKLTDNEINRVVALQMTNSPKVVIPAAGNTPTARKNAELETRWSNQVLPTCERVAAKPIRRRVVDCQNEIGRAAYEVFLTGTYDDLDMKAQVIDDPKTGLPREETAAEINKRTDEDVHSRRPPFGIRYIDGLSLYFREDEDGICEAAIVELKPVPQVKAALRRRGQDTAFLPKPGDEGWPREVPTQVPSIETIRYYDRRWYAWVVGDQIVDGGPTEHLQPGVPIFPVLGMVTGSPDAEFQHRGICAGLESTELGINDLLTVALDNSRRYNRPRWFLETPANGQTIGPNGGGAPVNIDLSGEKGVFEGRAGQRLINVLQGWEPYGDKMLVAQLQQMWEHNGINPVLQGESPGAAAAGYTVNALQGSASRMYEDNISNEATAYGKMIDHIRLMVRDTIGERTPLAAPMTDGGETVEWLDLTPNQVTEVPAIVTIDSTSDANRLAKRESLQQAMKEGIIKRSRVQSEGFGIDDTDAEDDQIVIDQGIQQLQPFILQAAFNTVRGMMQPPPPPQGSGLVDANGQPMPPSGGPGQMAPPNAPPVGAGLAAASQGGSPFETQPGPAALPPATARAGQGRNYVPQPGRPG